MAIFNNHANSYRIPNRHLLRRDFKQASTDCLQIESMRIFANVSVYFFPDLTTAFEKCLWNRSALTYSNGLQDETNSFFNHFPRIAGLLREPCETGR